MLYEVITFEGAGMEYRLGERVLVKNFSPLVQRGDKIALVGPNGCGKTTLIKLLLGELQPSAGKLRCGTKLEVAYFDQYRQQLDPDRTA